MNLPRTPRGGLLAALGATAALTLIGAAAVHLVSAHGGDTSKIHACVRTASGGDDGGEGGQIRVVDANATCRRGETALDWNIQGMKGDTGPAGPKGDSGPTGPAGRDGRDGVSGGGSATPAKHAIGLLSFTGASEPALQNIPILAFSAPVENKTSIGSASGGAGAGKATLNGVVIEKAIDASTPLLFKELVTGGHFAAADITLCRTTDCATSAYASYHFALVFVSAITAGGAEFSGGQTETLTLVAGSEGGTVGSVSECWDVTTNRSC